MFNSMFSFFNVNRPTSKIGCVATTIGFTGLATFGLATEGSFKSSCSKAVETGIRATSMLTAGTIGFYFGMVKLGDLICEPIAKAMGTSAPWVTLPLALIIDYYTATTAATVVGAGVKLASNAIRNKCQSSPLSLDNNIQTSDSNIRNADTQREREPFFMPPLVSSFGGVMPYYGGV